jgi:Glyoxalase/Bleomycin resistance protein/Dioxygenase superfamily
VIEPYHTGIIVDDLATAIPSWEGATGLSWGSVYAGPLTVRTPATDETVTHRVELAYSSDLRLELVKLLPGTCWTVNGGTGVHHTGCWSADLDADAARLEAQGWPIVAHGVDDDGAMAIFSYHQVPGVGLLELVSITQREMLAAMVRGSG